MRAAKRIQVRVDATGVLTADLAALSPKARQRALSVVRETLRDLGDLDPPGEELSPTAWEAAWAPTLRRRMRELDSGRVKSVPADRALERIGRAARGRR
jgi:hypothetical protein